MADDDQYNDDGSSSSSGKICMIYDRDDFFTVLVQIGLALFALMSLYVKRLQEVPRRTFKTWFLDCSKQAFGASYAHVLNMVRIRHDNMLCYVTSCYVMIAESV
jgi:hypothetical protein